MISISSLLTFTLLSLCSLVRPSNYGENGFTLDGYAPYARVVANGELCTTPNTNCADPNALCVRKPFKTSGFCKCRPEFHFDRKSYKCIRSIAIGEPCSDSRECHSFDRHSYCDITQLVRKRRPICVCQSKYIYSHEKHRCVHCRSTLTDCRDPLIPLSANSLAKHKFAFLIKLILIVIGFSLLLSLTFCFFIKILNGYSKSRRSSGLSRSNNQPIPPSTPPAMGTITTTSPPPPPPLQPLPLSSSSFHPFPPLPPPIPPINGTQPPHPQHQPPPAGLIDPMTSSIDRNRVHFNLPYGSAPKMSQNNSKSGRSISSNLNSNCVNSSTSNSDQRLLYASSSTEDKPPSYEEAVHGSICKRNLLISLSPNLPLKGNPV